MKRKVIFATVVLSTAFVANVFAATTYKDVPSNHWAKATIDWGTADHVAVGYPDGTFKPEASVTEAEFLAMLINSFTQVEKGNSWDDGYYTFAVKMNWPTNGATDKNARGWKITRERVAEIVAGATGVNYQGDNAIRYLLGKGLAKGLNPNEISVASYQGSSNLTRAQAVQFIRTVKESGLSELKERPIEPSNPSDIPPLPVANTGSKTITLKKVSKEGTKLPPSPVTDFAIDAFLNSIKFENGLIKGKVPAIPKGYAATISYGGGEIDVKPGYTFAKPVDKTRIVSLSIAKDGWEGVNGVVIIPSTGEYWRDTK